MARRRIGQESLTSGQEARAASSLNELSTLLDWSEIDYVPAGISAAARGEQGWPPLVLFQAVLLATWHDLSDEHLAEALDDRDSFRGFCGFTLHEPTPERTAFMRFRAELVRCSLHRISFDLVTRQLDRRGIVGRTGTLMDATLRSSASIRHDGDARCAEHRRRKPVDCFKAHVATDQDAVLIRGVEITMANVHDAAELGTVLPDAPGDMCGDSASQVVGPRRPSAHAPAHPVSCAQASGMERLHSLAWKPTMREFVTYAVGSRTSSAPVSAPMVYTECAGSGSQD